LWFTTLSNSDTFRKDKLFFSDLNLNEGKRVKTLLYTTICVLLLGGCSGYTFEPENSAPKNEHEALVKAQQSALAEQQESMLNE